MKNYQDELNYERKVGVFNVSLDEFEDDGDEADCD